MAVIDTYLTFFYKSFKSQAMYHLAAAMGLLGSVLNFFIQACLWTVLIKTGVRQDITRLTLQEMMLFVAINTMAAALTQPAIINELGAEIRDGSVIMHFLRPVSFRLYVFCVMMGKNAYRMATSALPVILISCFFIEFPSPPSPACALASLASLFLGTLIVFELVYITALLAFWTQATWYLSWYLNAGITFLGGTFIPLWFYPQSLRQASAVLPFRYITFEAIDLWLGKIPLGHAAQSLAVALGWALALFGVSSLLWRRALKKMTINGG
ncbi:MAG: ABC-2 family transporter protein [Treponema sp.]|nr:ABC-2 family transporter protein [Treponema sp.]